MSVSSSDAAIASYTSGVTPLTTPLLTRFRQSCQGQSSWFEVQAARYPTSESGSVITAALEFFYGFCALEVATNGAPIVYSPGACPDGYTPASTITSSISSQIDYTSICCLEGLTLLSSGQWRNSCGNLIQTSDQVIYISYNQTNDALLQTMVDSFFIVDTPYTVAWASSELNAFTPASLPLKVASETPRPSSTFILPQHTTTSFPGESEGPKSNSAASRTPTSALNLSSGAQAGIGVGAGIVGIAIGSLLMWLIIRRRSRRQRGPSHQIERADAKYSNDSPSPLPNIPELSGGDVAAEIPTKEISLEMFVEAANEVEQDWAAAEAYDEGLKHELAGEHEFRDIQKDKSTIKDFGLI